MKRILLSVLALSLFAGCSEINEQAEPAVNIMTEQSVSETQASTDTVITTQETDPPIITKTVTFTALGDNLIHSSIYKQAKRRAENEGSSGYDFSYAYENIADLLDTADITVLNQETLICNDIYEPSNYPCFNSPTDLGDYMAQLGVDVFTIANNHTLDMGTDGLSACLDYYDERDMMCVGAYRNQADRDDIRVMECDGVRVSFLCYTESLNGLSLPNNTELQIGRTDDIELMKSEISKAKEISDICVVSLHWGTENSSTVEEYQQTTARILGEAGADVIIGNHPHVLRETETFTNPDGRETLCAYSLGNLISAQSVGKNLIGAVMNFSITLTEDGETLPDISEPEIIPIVTHYGANYSDVCVYKLSDYTPELADKHGVRANSKFSYDYIIQCLSEKNLLEQNQDD